MKKPLSFLVILLISLTLSAQDCNFYIPLEENRGLVFENYNRRDKLEGTQEITIKKVTPHSDYIEALVQARYFDTGSKLTHEMEFTIKCSGNELTIDIQSMIDQSLLAGFRGMDISMTTSDIMIPNNPRTGDVLPEASLQMTVSSSGMKISDLDMTIRNRNVEGFEKIDTPAGSFDVYKISYETYTEIGAMGIKRRITTKGVEYLAPGIGSVRSEVYDDRDRLQSYTVLSKIY
jgi:hypothetical protein